jgi:hypothetical protein
VERGRRAGPAGILVRAGLPDGWLGPDVLAGLTVWAVLVPEALAYATIAGVPPVVGLYAAVPALVLYAAFGSSRHLVVGPMSPTASRGRPVDLLETDRQAMTLLPAASNCLRWQWRPCSPWR